MRIETDSPTLEFYIWSSIQQKIMVPTSMEFLAKNKKKIRIHLKKWLEF
jgi:hypothetical protein